MINSKLHTFKEILDKGIWVQDKADPAKGKYRKTDSIYVPKIQRDYAQGRSSEAEIRKDFLDDLFAALLSDTDIELSFVFGSRVPLPKDNKFGFEIMDGQQRLTTLFLFHWYAEMRELEKDKRNPILNKFTYETRDTSTDFLLQITGKDQNLVLLPDKYPSEIIKRRKWFTDEFLCDPTVNAMLGMIDAIHDRYSSLADNSGAGLDSPSMHEKLDHLKFYILLLENFDRCDELYIKMNSRGLSLTPFENFKASLVKYLKPPVDADKNLFWFDFTSKIDATWIDLFWKYDPDNGIPEEAEIIINDKKIGEEYLRFFNRYFFTKSALLEPPKNDDASKKQIEEINRFFYQTDKGEMPDRLTNWNDRYIPLFNAIPDLFESLANVFQALHDNLDDFLEIIRKEPFGNLSNFLDNLYSGSSSYSYTLSHRAIFGVLTEFIETIPTGLSIKDPTIKVNFERLSRIIFNVVENTLIESEEAAISVMRGLVEIIKLPGALTRNLYESFAKGDIASNNSQLKEEKIKAEKMCSSGSFDPSWEKALTEAEVHPFFKGSVGFFFDDSLNSPKDFRERYNVMKDLFDEKGISPVMKNNGHKLIRALMTNLNTWNLLEEHRITEKVESEKYLKNFVTGNKGVRGMFIDYFINWKNQETMEEHLDRIIASASAAPGETSETAEMILRLTSDSLAPKIYDWIADKEGSSKKDIFRVHKDYYWIAKPGKWHDYLLFDSQRRHLIPALVKANSLEDSGSNWNEELKDFTEKEVYIYKTLHDAAGDDVKLTMIFNENKWLEFRLPLEIKDKLIAGNHIQNDHIKSDHVLFKSIPYKDASPAEVSRISSEISSLQALIASL